VSSWCAFGAWLLLTAAWAAAARAQSLVEVVPEDPCAQARALAPTDDGPAAQELRRACRLQRFDGRLAAERQREIVAAEETRTARIERWIDRNQPPRATRPFSVDGFAGTGLSSYGLSAAWAFVSQAELAAWLGRRSITCDSLNQNGGADCSRTSFGFRGRWYLLPTKVTPFLSAGLAITAAHLQIRQSMNGSTMLLAGDGRANSLEGGGGVQIAYAAFRLSVEYAYEDTFYTGASKNDPKKTPNGDLDAVWSDSLKADRHGIRVQVGYAF
jgi:hypothetical protein